MAKMTNQEMLDLLQHNKKRAMFWIVDLSLMALFQTLISSISWDAGNKPGAYFFGAVGIAFIILGISFTINYFKSVALEKEVRMMEDHEQL